MEIESRYYAYETDLWERLAALLPTDQDAARFRDCRAAGEQEAGLTLLTKRLLEDQVPVADMVRAELEVLAEEWGERTALHAEIASCVRDSGEAGAVRLVADECAAPIDAAALGLGATPLAGLLVIPWIQCNRCASLLCRVHDRDPRGGLRQLASHYIIGHRRQVPTDETEIYAENDLYSAFESLRNCTHPR
ncbi:hypothetical protein [Nocardia sp. NPDC057668]|uniref:hypothetical protein n=1 Tax=Nocardia sp. NPDC057668 TaxID=3346202 RepID=UPI00366B0680